jgi:hypothetical protein
MGCHSVKVAKPPEAIESAEKDLKQMSVTQAVQKSQSRQAIPHANEMNFAVLKREAFPLHETSAQSAGSLNNASKIFTTPRIEVLPNGKQEAAIRKLTCGTATKHEIEEAKKIIADQYYQQEREHSMRRQDEGKRRRADTDESWLTQESSCSNRSMRDDRKSTWEIPPGSLVAVKGVQQRAKLLETCGDFVRIRIDYDAKILKIPRSEVTFVEIAAFEERRQKSFKLPAEA